MRKVSPKAAKRYEARQIARIRKWRQRRPGWLARATAFLTAPVVWLLRNIIPHGAVEATLHGNLKLARGWARERVTLRTLGASSFDELTTADLLHSDRAVRKVHSRAIYLAGGMGFVAGLFGFLALPVSMAGAMNIALRTIHRIGLCYGYAEPTEAEQLFVYYTLSLAGNRTPAEKAASLRAMRELQAQIDAAADRAADEALHPTVRHKALDIAHHDFSREITKQLVQVRLLTAIPVIGAVIGIIVDAGYIRSVGWAARHAYQLRWLHERGRWPDGEEAAI
jgi:hypothetical protein